MPQDNDLKNIGKSAAEWLKIAKYCRVLRQSSDLKPTKMPGTVCIQSSKHVRTEMWGKGGHHVMKSKLINRLKPALL